MYIISRQVQSKLYWYAPRTLHETGSLSFSFYATLVLLITSAPNRITLVNKVATENEKELYAIMCLSFIYSCKYSKGI